MVQGEMLQSKSLMKVVIFICGMFVVFFLLVGWVLLRTQTAEARIGGRIGTKHAGISGGVGLNGVSGGANVGPA